jgi:hypothetical protein
MKSLGARKEFGTLTQGRLIRWGLPIILLAVPMFAVFWLHLPGVFASVIVASGIGLLLRPAHLWVIWIQSIVLWWLAGWGE